jgi:hypothetical protein
MTIPHQNTYTAKYVEPTYGGWSSPRSQGVPGLSPVATGVVILGLLVTIPTWMIGGLVAGLACLGSCLLLLALVGPQVGGRCLGQWAAARVAFAVNCVAGGSVYRSGAASARPTVGHPAPGLLSRVACHSLLAPWGQPFGLLEHPGGRWSIVLACSPAGAELVAADTLDNRVAAWGGFLTELTCWPEVVCLQHTVATRPDDGAEFFAAVEKLTAVQGLPAPAEPVEVAELVAPLIARIALEQTAAALAAGTVRRESWCAITFTTSPIAAQAPKERRAVVMGQHLARLFPALQSALAASGAGATHPMSAAEIADLVAGAFDATGGRQPGRSWRQAGPVAAVESWGTWRHDSGTSITWAATDPPAGAVTRDALAALLAPDPDGATRRVCLTYRPHRAEDARRLASRTVRQASWRQTGKPGVGDAGDDIGVAAARQTQRELAQGAGLVSFSLHVTTTVLDAHPMVLEAAMRETQNAAAASGIGLRRCWAHQNAAFTQALGIGVELGAHTNVSAAVRENL